jgi:hypothetical protein
LVAKRIRARRPKRHNEVGSSGNVATAIHDPVEVEIAGRGACRGRSMPTDDRVANRTNILSVRFVAGMIARIRVGLALRPERDRYIASACAAVDQ